MMSRFLLCVVALLFVGEFVLADDLTERRSVPSPDRQFVVVFLDSQTFAIRDTHGTAVISSRDLPHLRDVIQFLPEHVSWSPDSQILAIAGGGGHDLETFIFIRRGDSFLPVSVPHLTDRYDNPSITPAKWLNGHRLILDISGPNAGKANGYYYKGRATIHVSMTPPTCEVLYKHITEHNGSNDSNGA